MDRCAAAYAYHKQGYNCAQSVAGAFADLTGTAPEQLMAAMGGFGGGVGGSHEELCGAVSGGVLVLSLLHPHTDGEDRAGKVRLYAQAKEFRRRFQEVFGLTRCGDLLRARPGVTERNPASQRLGVTAHCDNMIVTAVEILEQMLQEEPHDLGRAVFRGCAAHAGGNRRLCAYAPLAAAARVSGGGLWGGTAAGVQPVRSGAGMECEVPQGQQVSLHGLPAAWVCDGHGFCRAQG